MKIGGVISWAINKLIPRVCTVQSIYTIAVQNHMKNLDNVKGPIKKGNKNLC